MARPESWRTSTRWPAVVLYCRSGHRAGVAKSILEKNGFSDVTNGGGLKDMPPR
jgi:phage shock protein E